MIQAKAFRWSHPASKWLSAFVSPLAMSLFMTIQNVVTVHDRMPNTYYYSFGYSFVIGFLIILTVSLFLILPLSFLADGIVQWIINQIRNFGIWTGVITSMLIYILVCGIGGQLVGMTFRSLYLFPQAALAALIFWLFQTGFSVVIYLQRKEYKL
ncbi:hypothetical protein [Paenibacillus lemnae]|uniref:Uncharacterized protein n=1 Tax=Paenibacillus lemnae TaxID=1330551 RepID=A0A848M9X2_PAELE|nr:hypothetical protein [Paenibacillus lemnae]NMO97847.1 hypothetical protein [Paenibacillus lemnae]